MPATRKQRNSVTVPERLLPRSIVETKKNLKRPTFRKEKMSILSRIFRDKERERETVRFLQNHVATVCKTDLRIINE